MQNPFLEEYPKRNKRLNRSDSKHNYSKRKWKWHITSLTDNELNLVIQI